MAQKTSKQRGFCARGLFYVNHDGESSEREKEKNQGGQEDWGDKQNDRLNKLPADWLAARRKETGWRTTDSFAGKPW